MRYTTIPNTKLTASVLCLGTGGMCAEIDRETSYQMLDTFIARGGNFLDTAKIYNDWIPGETSRSEKLLGVWMKERGNRQNIVLATKGAHPHLESMNVPRLSPVEIVSDLEASLRHLQTETIDLYWLHRDDPDRPVGDIIETLHAQAQAGKIRYYGCSNWRLERIQAAQEYAIENGLPGFAGVQNLWNLAVVNPGSFADQTIAFMDAALWQYHLATNLAAVPYTSQANGFFSKIKAGGIEKLPSNLKDWFLNPESFERYERVVKLCAETGLSITQVVLGFLTSQPFPSYPIAGPKSVQQLEDCLAGGEVRLDPIQVRYLEGKSAG